MGLFMLLGLAGAIGGGVFWLIRRPDKDRAASPVTHETRPTDDETSTH